MAPALEFLSLASYFSGFYLFVSPSPSKKIKRVLAMLGFQSEVSVEVSHLLYIVSYMVACGGQGTGHVLVVLGKGDGRTHWIAEF